MGLSMDGMVWSICEILLTLGSTFPTFIKQDVLPRFLHKPDFYSFEGSFISLITYMNQSVVSDQTAT